MPSNAHLVASDGGGIEPDDEVVGVDESAEAGSAEVCAAADEGTGPGGGAAGEAAAAEGVLRRQIGFFAWFLHSSRRVRSEAAELGAAERSACRLWQKVPNTGVDNPLIVLPRSYAWPDSRRRRCRRFNVFTSAGGAGDGGVCGGGPATDVAVFEGSLKEREPRGEGGAGAVGEGGVSETAAGA